LFANIAYTYFHSVYIAHDMFVSLTVEFKGLDLP